MNKQQEVKEELVHIRNKDGDWLEGDVTFPINQQHKNPAVILVHGFGVDRYESGWFSEFSYKLSSAGYLVFKFDFSGCGNSEGDYRKTSLTKLSNDLETILKYVKSRKEVNKNKIGILAQSFGTSVTITLKPDVNTIILMGSISEPYEVMKELFKEDFNPNNISSRKRSDGSVTKVESQFWIDLKEHNLIKGISKIACPILFIHGKKDDTVPLSEMWNFYHAKKGGKETIELKGANHGLRPKRKEVFLFVEDWFNKHLKR